MLHQIITYIKWLPTTFHLHGIHSPFVFSFEKKCLKNKTLNTTDHVLKAYKNKLLKNNQVISVTDYGAGSRVFISNQRKVKDIARHAGASLSRMKLIRRVVNYFNPEHILEIGTSLGMGTLALASTTKAQITSLEGCPETAKVAKEYLNDFDIKNVTIRIGEFSETLNNLLQKKYDLIYFDGNHSKEATIHYVQSLLPSITNNTIWIFDDIHWSSQMTEAWDAIKELPEVTATIDCFWLGFIFFRKEQQKEHFSIKL